MPPICRLFAAYVPQLLVAACPLKRASIQSGSKPAAAATTEM
ncbi:hypothetical protein [Duganella sp. BuS-21]